MNQIFREDMRLCHKGDRGGIGFIDTDKAGVQDMFYACLRSRFYGIGLLYTAVIDIVEETNNSLSTPVKAFTGEG